MEIARIIVYGDIHLSSKNYGGHNDYAKECLDCFKKITQICEEYKATHLIGLGDFTYGRFTTLEFRAAVEAELIRQSELVNGNRFEVKGNHDTASYGMTEYEYYIGKGLLKESQTLNIGNARIHMIDSGKSSSYKLSILEGGTNIALAHDYYRFSDTTSANFGKSIELDTKEDWFGLDYLICGHVHSQMAFSGTINKGDKGHRLIVHYPGALSRPSYREGHMDEIGQLGLITIEDSGNVRYSIIEVELPSLEESFNESVKEDNKRKKEEKEKRVDISDIIKQLDSHERDICNPEDIINGLNGVDNKYKIKAIELLKLGMG